VTASDRIVKKAEINRNPFAILFISSRRARQKKEGRKSLSEKWRNTISTFIQVFIV